MKWTRVAPRLLPAGAVRSLVFLFVFSFAVYLPAQTTTSSAQGQFRRTVDPSDRSASGTVSLVKKGDKQVVQVEIKGLAQESFAIFIGSTPTFDTNSLVQSVAPLDRTSLKKGQWSRVLIGTNGAPAELPVEDLSQLAGGNLVIAKPGDIQLETGVTNIVGNTTNIIFGIPLPLPNVTNMVLAALWAPLSPRMVSHASETFSRVATMSPPQNAPPPSPGAVGFVKVKFNGPQGRSILDVEARNLVRGQVYSVFVSDSTDSETAVLIKAGEMTLSKSGSRASFVRDTQFGDPLPQQAANIGDLSGRLIVIADEFDDFHLEATIPGP